MLSTATSSITHAPNTLLEPTLMGVTYHTYLLRYWRVQPQPDGSGWRFMLMHPHTGAHRTFADFAALMHFLQEQIQVYEPGETTTARSEESETQSTQFDG